MRPFVIVISGLPATGKSTLAKRIGTDLKIPVISRDEVRSANFDGTPAAMRSLTRTVHAALGSVLADGGSAVLDGNFNTAEHSDGLADLVRAHGAVAIEVCLWGDVDVLRKRFAERAAPPLTEGLRPYFEKVVHRERRPVLSDAVRTMEFDTTDFGDLNYEEILATIRSPVP